MKIFAIDTSGKTASVAISQDGVVVDFIEKDTNLNHSQTGVLLCKQLLEKTNMSFEDIDAYAVVVGPGSFTGIRIGIAIAKALAFTLNKPLFGISALECVAHANGQDGLVCSLIKARETDYFYHLYNCQNGQIISQDEANSDDILNIKEKYKGLNVTFCEKDVRAMSASVLAYQAYKRGDNSCVHDVAPLYLKLSQAERMMLEKNKQ